MMLGVLPLYFLPLINIDPKEDSEIILDNIEADIDNQENAMRQFIAHVQRELTQESHLLQKYVLFIVLILRQSGARIVRTSKAGRSFGRAVGSESGC